jgi:hypothetical protein
MGTQLNADALRSARRLRLTNWWHWAWIIFLFDASVPRQWAGITHSASHGFRVVISGLVYVFVVAGLAAVGAVSVMLAAALPFG